MRFPFLDEDVSDFLRSLPLDQICNLEEKQGVGDKKFLRTFAESESIMNNQVKRAIHFGTQSNFYLKILFALTFYLERCSHKDKQIQNGRSVDFFKMKLWNNKVYLTL